MAKRELPSGTTPKLHVSKKIQAAIDAMVFEARPRAEAAKKAGIADHSLYKALRKPPTLEYLRRQMEALRTSAGAAGFARIAHLIEYAASEHVQFAASQWAAGVDGYSPTHRSENLHIYRGLAPGLTVNYLAYQAPEPLHGVIELRPAPTITMGDGRPMPKAVPHPSEVK